MGHLLTIRSVQRDWLWHQNPEVPPDRETLSEHGSCSWWRKWAGALLDRCAVLGYYLINLAMVRDDHLGLS